MTHPIVKQLEALNPEDGSLILLRVDQDRQRAFYAGTAQSIGRWIEQTKRYTTCVLMVSPDEKVETLPPRAILELLERMPKDLVEKVMDHWKIAHSLSPDDPNLVGMMKLQHAMSVVIDAAMGVVEAVEKNAEDEGRSWPYGGEGQKAKNDYDTALSALQELVGEIPADHLVQGDDVRPEPKEMPPVDIEELRAQRLKALEQEE